MSAEGGAGPSVAIAGWHGVRMANGELNVIGDVMGCMSAMGASVYFIPLLGDEKASDAFLCSSEPHFDAIVWWNWSGVKTEDMRRIRRARPRTKMIMYNWDDPHSRCIPDHWLDGRFSSDLYDMAFTSAGENAQLGRYAFPFETLYPPVLVARCARPVRDSHDFAYDVYFACTNMYSAAGDVKTSMNRANIVRRLSSIFGPSFGFFGPPAMRSFAPTSYRRQLSYDETLREPANARVCINIDGADGEGYVNERMVTLLACGSLVVTNGSNSLAVCANTEDDFVREVQRCVAESGADWAWRTRAAARAAAEERLDSAAWARRVLRACA
jgi:hypothetical protein